MIQNPFLLSDDKLGTLLKAYSGWLSKHPEEQAYNDRLKEISDQIQETFLNPAYLDEVKNAQFKGDIKAYISKLDGPVGIRLGDQRITDNLTRLKNNFRYIIANNDDPFVVAQSLIDGKKKIEYFSKAFWSPILQARYPDVIPNWNNKTENLLAIFGVKVKTTKLNAEAKLRKISEAFQYLQQLDPNLDFFHLNHLMHYCYIIDEGKQLIRDLLDISDPNGSDRARANVKTQVEKVRTRIFRSEAHHELIHSNEFYFENARESLDELMAFEIGASKDRLKQVISQYKDEEISFVDFLKKTQDPVAREFFELVGKFVAHIDSNAANKKEWNTTQDKRVISKTFFSQKNWVEQLYKLKTNSSFSPSSTVRTVIDYLRLPQKYLPIVSDNHKRQISNALLKTDYSDDIELTKNLKELFEAENFKIGNTANTSRIINEALYDDELRPIWDQKLSEEKEYIKGLAVADSTGWFETAIEELENNYHIVLRWDKSPSGGKKTLKLLLEAIRRDKEFFIYYISNNAAQYKATVVDFTIENDFKSKNWDSIGGVARCYPNFSDYNKTRGSGRISEAKILFLVSKLEKLTQPIPVKNFTFLKLFESPIRNNMQPFVEVLYDPPPYEPRITKREPIKIINHIHQYTSGMGFRYDIKDLANFYLSLKTKPFVILAGISGTGKTKLVELFAESIGYGDPEHCVIIPVKPDWTDNSDLMGYTNLNKEFEKKKLTEVILNAHKNPDEPYFIILDEMNLARVEHYFSDFLSIIETRSLKDDKIHTKPLLYGSEVGDNTRERESIINIGIPENLYIIGTVNMDETTFPFSKKVLDRANSIEMNQVELDFIQQAEEVKPMNGVFNDFLRSDKINSKHLSEEDHLLLVEKKFTEELKKINDILARVDLQFAYRIRDEMAFYLLNSDKISEIISWEEAMDYQVMQKILPRIQGSAISISHLLIHLINHFMDEKGKFEEKSHYEEIQGNLREYIGSGPKYSRTLKKLDFMLRRYSQDGFTSFWI